MKKTQLVMFWFLPVILILGLFFPIVGYLVLIMMVFFLVLAFFKKRYWCWNLCPRGSFLDLIISKISLNRHIPKLFLKPFFRYGVFFFFVAFLCFRIIKTGGSILAIGAVFVSMCVLTTLISIVLGVSTRHRAWCMICPMGTLQEKIGNLRKNKNKNPV